MNPAQALTKTVYLASFVIGAILGHLLVTARREIDRHSSIAYDAGFIAGLSSRAAARAAEDPDAPIADRSDPQR
jgi:hypothetical protein